MSEILAEWNDGGTLGLMDDITFPAVALDPKLEGSMFTIRKVNYQPPHPVVSLVTSNNNLVIGLQNGTLKRLNLNDPEEVQQIEISKKESIHKLFLDPTGNHLIITMENEDNYYLNTKSKKPKPLGKQMRGHIEACAWDRSGQSTTTIAHLLVGTRSGQIYELVIDSTQTALSFLGGGGKERAKQLFLLPDQSITGIACETFPASDTTKFFVMVTTHSRIYQFIGGPTYEALFQHYENKANLLRANELPGTSTGELQFFSAQGGLATAFAWLSGAGILHGDIVFGSQKEGDTMADKQELTLYTGDVPISMVLTEFHYLLLHPDKFVAMSKIDDSIAYQFDFRTEKAFNKALLGFARDPVMGYIFVYSPSAVWEVTIQDEDRNVWEKLLAKGFFESAIKVAKLPAHKDKIWIKWSEHFFNNKQYSMAATHYAKTGKSLEEICLKFIAIEQEDALRHYLKEKLKYISEKERTQNTMICTWLCELFLDKINALEYDKDAERATLQKQFVLEEFYGFLEEHEKHLSPDTTYQLMASHARIDELLFYARLIKDYDTLIIFHLQRRQWKEALEVLYSQSDAKYYKKYSPILMEHYAYQTVSLLIKGPRKEIEPKDLIPALMRYEAANEELLKKPPVPNSPESEHQGIRYLNHVMLCGEKDAAVHNYLLSLYTKYYDEEPLISFLQQKEAHFDLPYALGLCKTHNKIQASIIILSKMRLYSEALETSLKVNNIDLARSIADIPQHDDDMKDEDKEELRKKMWLMIARHVVEKNKQIKNAMAYLQDCELLKIEDILPFFPDFVLIDDFKEAIITALQQYNHHLDTLQNEMKETTRSAELIREDIKLLRNNYVKIEGSQKCELCSFPILTSSFYLFPCGHVYHCTCLQEEMKRHLTHENRMQLEQSLQRLDSIENAQNPKNQSLIPRFMEESNDDLPFLNDSFFQGAGNIISNIAHMTDGDRVDNSDKRSSDSHSRSTQVDKQQLKDIIDSLVAYECFLCGQIMIDSIDVPFDEEL